MYQEIKDILLGKTPSKGTQEEISEVWALVFGLGLKHNKQLVNRLCDGIKTRANLLRHPDPEDKCPQMWVSIFLFTSFKKLPLYINHKDREVRVVVTWRLGKGR